MAPKRTLEAFFGRPEAEPKRQRHDTPPKELSHHPSYPFPLPKLPLTLRDELGFCPMKESQKIDNQPDLDLLYFNPYLLKDTGQGLFKFLRDELFFYRVQYNIKRGSFETEIKTPRFTTVFGVDESSVFNSEGALLDAKTKKPVPLNRYQCRPRPIPSCLDSLRTIIEGSTECSFNFCLVNYYANGNDSISYHSDDERFLGPEPSIASVSLGATRDFLLKHKPATDGAKSNDPETKPLKFQLTSGDVLLMRGKTQSHWLHSIPKRKGGDSDKGRINITFRKALVYGGTENYYRYNVGTGPVYKWDDDNSEMRLWSAATNSSA